MADIINWSSIEGLFRGLTPNKRINVWQWADENRVLSPLASSEPGQWRTARVPYLREIMYNLSSESPAQRISCMKGAQLALTEGGLNWLGYIIDIDPGPTLIVMGTEDALKKNSISRIDPMIKDCPSLSKKIPPNSTKTGNNNMFQKVYEGGILMMSGANSATGLRSMPIRYLMLDEVDSYPSDLDGEGSPVALAEARTSNFPNKKIYKISTPTIKGESLIEKEYENTDKRKYFVPCPSCGTQQVLHWEQVGWELGKGGKPTKVWYECEHCHEHIDEINKTKMLELGEWRATDPTKTDPQVVGYHISTLYSPYGWYSWTDMAKEYLEALNDEVKMKTFWNTRLGLPYAVKGEAPNWELLRAKAEPYKPNHPPMGVVFLTCGVDVQRDRLELEIVGWGRDKKSWSIDYRTIMGDTADKTVWDNLAMVLSETWTREDGLQMSIMKMAVDSGDHTSHVYNFVRRFDVSRVVAVKGQASKATIWSRPNTVDITSNGVVIGNTQLYSVGVNILKSELYSFLGLHKDEHGNAPHGYCYFPDAYPAEYFKGLASEQLQEVRNQKGYTVLQWVKTYRRNEPLDCRNYARAAASIFNYDNFKTEHFDTIERGYSRKSVEKLPKKEKKSSFWD